MNILQKSNIFYKKAISNYFDINGLNTNTEFQKLLQAARKRIQTGSIKKD